MEKTCHIIGDSVIVQDCGRFMHIVLNSPQTLNSLTLDFVRQLHLALDLVESRREMRMLMMSGDGPKGFCAGGNVKILARAAMDGDLDMPMSFFETEYALDLRLHRLGKPFVVMANGFCMGGGMGLSAGADMILAAPDTKMAMPETMIGFFPDVGASRWLFDKLPPGYPEFMGLTGPNLYGRQCTDLGLATHLVDGERLEEILEVMEDTGLELSLDREEGLAQLDEALKPFVLRPEGEPFQPDPAVRRLFAGAESVSELMAALEKDGSPLAQKARLDLLERSPTACALTLILMRLNQDAPLDQALDRELKAAHFMIRQPDYVEGIRSKLIDKDNTPQWTKVDVDALQALDLTP